LIKLRPWAVWPEAVNCQLANSTSCAPQPLQLHDDAARKAWGDKTENEMIHGNAASRFKTLAKLAVGCR
jgi:hypothetical protein